MPVPPWLSRHGGSLLASGAVHALLLFGTTGAVVQPVRYEVEAGSGGMEVSLIAAPLPPVEAPPPPAIPNIPEAALASDDWLLETVPLPPPQEGAAEAPAHSQEEHPDTLRQAALVYGDGSSPAPGHDPTTVYLPGGAATGKRGRFRNPAPPYPYAAIQQQQEGLVTLEAVIDKAGRPVSVEITQRSGFPLLDQSALRTVRRWKFDPAHIGFLPVQSRIVIPIRFVLEDRLRAAE